MQGKSVLKALTLGNWIMIVCCGPQKFRLPLRPGNSESGHEKVSLLLEVSEVVIG
jgi:hypothetical protein